MNQEMKTVTVSSMCSSINRTQSALPLPADYHSQSYSTVCRTIFYTVRTTHSQMRILKSHCCLQQSPRSSPHCRGLQSPFPDVWTIRFVQISSAKHCTDFQSKHGNDLELAGVCVPGSDLGVKVVSRSYLFIMPETSFFSCSTASFSPCG